METRKLWANSLREQTCGIYLHVSGQTHSFGFGVNDTCVSCIKWVAEACANSSNALARRPHWLDRIASSSALTVSATTHWRPSAIRHSIKLLRWPKASKSDSTVIRYGSWFGCEKLRKNKVDRSLDIASNDKIELRLNMSRLRSIVCSFYQIHDKWNTMKLHAEINARV